LIGGLSLEIFGSVSMIHDQLSPPKNELPQKKGNAAAFRAVTGYFIVQEFDLGNI